MECTNTCGKQNSWVCAWDSIVLGWQRERQVREYIMWWPWTSRVSTEYGSTRQLLSYLHRKYTQAVRKTLNITRFHNLLGLIYFLIAVQCLNICRLKPILTYILLTEKLKYSRYNLNTIFISMYLRSMHNLFWWRNGRGWRWQAGLRPRVMSDGLTNCYTVCFALLYSCVR